MMSDNSINPRVTTLGSFMMDLVAYTPRRPKSGETLRGESFAIALGGKGFNQAISAGRAGAQSAMLGNLGTDGFGDDFMKAFGDEGVNSADIERSADLGTGVGHISVQTSDGDNSIIIIPQSNDLGDANYISRHAKTIIESDVLLLQLELPIDGNLAAAKLAKDNGVTDEAALALIEAQAYPHFLDIMALLFILNVGIMLLIGKLYPRKEEFVQEHTKQVDITPWKYTTQAGIAICVIVIGIYIYFA